MSAENSEAGALKSNLLYNSKLIMFTNTELTYVGSFALRNSAFCPPPQKFPISYLILLLQVRVLKLNRKTQSN